MIKRHWSRWLAALLCCALLCGGAALSESEVEEFLVAPEAETVEEAQLEEVIEAEEAEEPSQAAIEDFDVQVEPLEAAAEEVEAPLVAEASLAEAPVEEAASAIVPSESVPSALIQEPVQVTLEFTSIQLFAGQNTTLRVSTQAPSVTFTSDNGDVAWVSAEGVISARSAGTATITVAEPNGGSATCVVTVYPMPQSVSLNLKKANMGLKEKRTLVASIPSGIKTTYKWKSSKKSVATVNADGVVTAKKLGKATITVTTYNGKTAKCVITVKRAPASVKLNQTSLTLYKGNTKKLKATLSPADSASVLRWTSGNQGVVSVSNTGKLKAVGVGKAKVKVKTYNGKASVCKVTVLPMPDEIRVARQNVTLIKGKTFALKAKAYGEGKKTITKFTYKSSKKGVATVSATGIVTARRKGTAVITVKAHNGVTKKVQVTVKNRPVIKVLTKSLTLTKGSTQALNPVVKQDGVPTGAAVTCKSTNTAVATVNASGVVTAKKAGTASIIFKSAGANTVTVKVTVKNPPQNHPTTGTVYITPSGSKYHRQSCPTLARSKTIYSVSVSEAQAKGLGPCKVCNP